MTLWTRRRLSAAGTGLLLGAITGIVDIVLVREGWTRAGLPLPWYSALAAIWTWVTVCGIAGLIVSFRPLRHLRGVALAVAGPGLLLLSRASSPFKEATSMTTLGVLLIWLGVVAVLSIPFYLIPYAELRFPGRLAASLGVSAAILFALAGQWYPAAWTWKQAASETAGKPNVVLVFLDTTRYDDALASRRPSMPHLQRFAQNATTFESAWAPASWTVPSHLATLTGTDPWTIDTDGEAIGPTLAQRFRSMGYETAAVFSNPLLNPDAGFQRGFQEFTYSNASGVCVSAIGDLLMRSLVNNGPRMPVCAWLKASEITARGLRFVRRARRPYFLALNYLDAHEPHYVSPECRDSSYTPSRREEREQVLNPSPGSPPQPAVVRRVREQYRQAMRCMDRSLGQLLDGVQQASAGPTVIAIVGDHGEQFGAHGLGSHGNSIYAQLIHVPLVLKVPGQGPGRVSDPVSITDLYLTLLRAADPSHDGRPLPLLDASQRRAVVSNYAAMGQGHAFSVVEGDYHLIRWADGREAMYDYRHDPRETHPVDIGQRSELAGSMRERLMYASRQSKGRSPFNALGYLE
jgi:arylsulfatase A-like enzyme